MVAAIAAVVGTALGAVLSYLFQERTARRAEASTSRRELRTERISVYASFLTALAEYQRGQLDSWRLRRDDPRGSAASAARAESDRLRALAQAAFSQVPFVAWDPAVEAAAQEAWELLDSVYQAEDPADLDARADRANAAVNRFTGLAALQVKAGYGVGDGQSTGVAEP